MDGKIIDDMRKAGMMYKDIAKEIKLSESSTRRLHKDYIASLGDPDIEDVGMVHALHKAGWGLEKIAHEFYTSIEKVKEALDKPLPPEDGYPSTWSEPNDDFKTKRGIGRPARKRI